MAKKINLDEKKHALNILRQLDGMKRDKRQCDFIVSVEGDEYYTHGNILCAASEYFNAMLTHDTKEKQHGKVEMMDIDSECVRVCIEYIYTGKAAIPEGKIEDLMHAAHLMQLDNLVEGLVVLFENDLDINTLFRTRKIAELYSLGNLLSKCKEFTDKNLELISMQPGFLDEPKKFVFDAINSESLSVTEEEKLIFSLRWARHDPNRVEHFRTFLNAINLKKVCLSYRRHLLENESLVANNLQLFRTLSISIMNSLRIQSENKEGLYGNKTVVIFDGKSGHLQYFDAQDEEIKKFHDVNLGGFWSYSAVSLCSHIYILLRNRSVHRLRIEDRYARWERVAYMIEEHGSYPPVVSYDGCLYSIGGGDGRSTATAEQYFPDENKWVRLTSMPFSAERVTLVSLDECIYSVGGFSDGECVDKFYRFTPSKSEWIGLTSMPRRKCNCSATAVNQNLYIMGGYDGEQYLTEVDRFNIATSQWTSLTPLIEPRALSNAFCISRMIYVVGGSNEETRKSIEKYDIEKDTWTKVHINNYQPSINWAVTI